MNKCKSIFTFACAMAAAGPMALAGPMAALQMGMTAYAATNSVDYQRKVISVLGIIPHDTTNTRSYVTRAQFAEYLVKASKYRDYLATMSNVSVYADVPKENDHAAAIRICAQQNWMTGYLGGLFKPDEPITLREAVRGVLAILGYTDADFLGNTTGGRMATYYSLGLNEDLEVVDYDPLTQDHVVTLLYNMLKAKMKGSNTVYATTLGASLTADGEVNPMELAENNLKGPKVIKKGGSLANAIPFSKSKASVVINNQAASVGELEDAIEEEDIVIYYNSATKSIFAYTTEGTDGQYGRFIYKGVVETIYYEGTGVMTPSAVVMDDGQEYKLGSAEMQFAFSLYGDLKVGDKITIICESTTDREGDVSYSIIDYID